MGSTRRCFRGQMLPALKRDHRLEPERASISFEADIRMGKPAGLRIPRIVILAFKAIAFNDRVRRWQRSGSSCANESSVLRCAMANDFGVFDRECTLFEEIW